MAYARMEIIEALRAAATRLREGAPYQWGHTGQCNCGHLAQVITGHDSATLHRMVLEVGGEWADRAGEYCADSGLEVDRVIGRLVSFGFNTNDLGDLERLSDPRILARLPSGRRYLQRNRREDVIEYLEAWADMLTEQLEARESVAPEPTLLAAE